jgi:4-amino-4-deoxy-L-arabinose transferase-like glycosyltransferase
VAALTVLGLALRLDILTESLIADELSTRWIISTNGFSGVWSTVHTDAEITPPLFFLASWLATQLYDAPEMARLPSLVAGGATIPVVYLLGLRTVGRTAALVAAAVVTLSPFTIYYSAEARAYALMIFLVALSTLAMLLAADQPRWRWWALYAGASCGAMYTHYTAAFVLATQLAWVLWTRPDMRRPALIANGCAALAFLPWLSGLRADFDSPTTEILSELSPFNVQHIRISLTHATVGYPYRQVALRDLPGVFPLVLFAVGVALGIAGLVRGGSGQPLRTRLACLDSRVVLVVVLAVSVPVGAALVSLVGTNLFSTRNLAASWPAYSLALAALLVAAGPRLRLVAIGCVLACLGVGSLQLALGDEAKRLDFKAAGGLIDRAARPGDVVVDAKVLTPGPISPLDLTLRRRHPIVRYGAPVQRRRPFGVFDPAIPRDEVIPLAARRAQGNRIFVVVETDTVDLDAELESQGYGLVRRDRFPGLAELQVQVWER